MNSKKRSEVLRGSREFAKFLESVKIKRIKLKKDNPLKPLKNSRLTLAITRQYKKYPNLVKELEDADIL